MNILCIETSTDVCSVGLVCDGETIALRESSERDHAARAAVFVHEVLVESGVKASELDAVAVSRGPGSYTGLRIGASLAKGLCFGLNIPLISIGSLEAITNYELRITNSIDAILIPMIDARRMEVYMQVFSADGKSLTEVEAKIIDENSFAEWRAEAERCGGEVCIFGDGAEKCRDVLPWAKYIEIKASAKGMARLADEALREGRFEDVAYFEPFYLKDFIITTPKK